MLLQLAMATVAFVLLVLGVARVYESRRNLMRCASQPCVLTGPSHLCINATAQFGTAKPKMVFISKAIINYLAKNTRILVCVLCFLEPQEMLTAKNKHATNLVAPPL